MCKEWKVAIINMKRSAIQVAKDRTPENFELKKRYRNIANREQRKAPVAYWYKKSEKIKFKSRDRNVHCLIYFLKTIRINCIFIHGRAGVLSK